MRQASMVGAVLVATFGLLGSAGSKWVTVRAGIGLREAIVGQTTRSDLLKGSRTAEYYAGQGLWFSFREDDRLIAVTIMGSRFRTEKGVRIGSTQETVAKAYGTPHLGDLPLTKGSRTIGAVGGVRWEYPGIHFTMSNGNVAAITVVPLDREVKKPRP